MNKFLLSKILVAGDEVGEGVEDATKDIFQDFEKILAFFDGNKIGKLVTNLIFSALIFFIGRKLIKAIVKMIKKSLNKSSLENSVVRFLGNVITVVLNTILIVWIVTILGIPTSSFVAILGSAGLAIGLALQGSISNFAGGVLILMLKPFKVNDYIVSNGIEGKVAEIDLFYTKLLTPDNQKIVIPNGGLSNSSIRNVPDEDYRRLDLSIPVHYDADIKNVRSTLNLLANNDERILKDRGVVIVVDSFGDSAVNIAFRTWVETAHYWDVKFELQEKILDKFRKEGIIIPYNQLDVTVTSN